MSELSPDARDLVAQARKQSRDLLGPSAEQRTQLRERLTPLWAAGATPARASTSLRWKVGSFALLAGLGLWTWLYTQPPAVPSAPPLTAAAHEAQDQPCAHAPSAVDGTSPCKVPANAQKETTALDVQAQRTCAGLECRRLTAADSAELEPAPARLTGAARKPKKVERGASLPADASWATLTGAARKPKKVELGASAAADAPQPTPLAATARKAGSRKLGATDPPLEPKLPAVAAAAEQPNATEPDLLASIGLGELEANGQAKAPDLLGRLEVSARTPRGGRAVGPVPPARLPLGAAKDRTPERAVQTDADPPPPSIDGELELLGAAQTALQKQRPTRALSLLQEHAFRFPTGAMVEERMAMQALALCGLQRRQAAQTVLSNLAARGSSSPLLPRVRSQCGL